MALLVPQPSGSIGNHAFVGDVVVLDVDGMTVNAPTKAKPWFKVNINAVLPPQGWPSAANIDWLVADGVRFYVIAEFPAGTADLSVIEPQPVGGAE